MIRGTSVSGITNMSKNVEITDFLSAQVIYNLFLNSEGRVRRHKNEFLLNVNVKRYRSRYGVSKGRIIFFFNPRYFLGMYLLLQGFTR